jgi:hypothetical protein
VIAKNLAAIVRESEGSALITSDRCQSRRQPRQQPGDPLARRIKGPETDEDIRLNPIECIAATFPELGTVGENTRGTATGKGHIFTGHGSAASRSL